MGVKLLFRTSHQVILTDYGNLFYQRALIAIRTFDSLQNIVKDTQEEKSGTIKIGVTPMIGTIWLVDYIVDFCDKYPSINIKLHVDGTKILEKELAKGNLDLVFGIIDVNNNSGPYEKIILLEDSMSVCMNKANKLSKMNEISLKDLRCEEFNSYSSGSMLSSILRNKCLENGFEPKIRFSSSNVDMIMQFTAHGKGICIVPRPFANRYSHISNLVRLPLKDNLPWTICLIKSKNNYIPYICSLFESYIRNKFQLIVSQKKLIPNLCVNSFKE
ncbi:LysR substrate-binding domain-containing protein [uncultured Acidaminococcus sp.]|uniref:LysR substrate-binding domain-containing protein n=1 Tax=uncultured Acidaminococcus sp. TaxID=352152 RepID=UPI0034575BA6